MIAGIGIYMLLRPRQSVRGRFVSVCAGTLLVARALSGRDGAIATLRSLSNQDSGELDDIDVATPWPHYQRVRTTAPRRARRSAAVA